MRTPFIFREALRRSTLLAIGLGLLMPGVSFQSGMASAEATSIEFEGVFYPCSGTPPVEEWISGNVLHFRDATNHNQWVTGNPLIDGFADNVVDADINLKTGIGVAHPRESLKPDAFDGTWEINVTVTLDPSGPTARGVGYGTGELHGLTINFTGGEQVPLGPGENPCSDIPFAVRLEGEIFTPAS